ncbi:hypothetical protein NEUTE1DRAFT_117496 [Neurospora tetrasperma FGSC 2508]|uniref:Lytic polysaccharide monooxygenase n=1 Tax=Neurospora tetrasperma (strain FGSC 2508 / ATCC MYA-4615 / P0657) TaxID=510951 RepID=F8MR41_NEUT8|nr:uncharacterized protein NEUTE1DRAFT_117496 [Neurospora tetrasperma FGSC 2508]EGO56821.1 hypothetical protein NEUTE1DRAFT_117496 [Neurospora tetrasperma FGSC 2508]EGZ70289.1 hypothetical protein NEUTE2DRAFT_144984 [Neurospora tetrasperma FGSC 2509]
MMYNTFTTGLVATLLAGAQIASAHIEMSYPPPFRSKFNPNADPGSIDYSMTAPLKDTGADYPCKGYQVDFGTPSGKSTATFVPGQTYNMTTAGTATHGGGSCQLSLSYDKGATFTVIESYIGDCPLAGKYDFTIPADAQSGDAIFAWTWHNRIGNREMYMNCAPVTIAANNKRDVAGAAFSTRPQIFVANVGNGCKTDENFDVQYPQPGPNVVKASDAPLKGPEGSCGASAAPAGGSDSGSGSGASSSSSVAAAPVTTSAAAQTSAATGGNPGGIFITAPSDGSNQGGIFLPSATDIVNAPSSSAAAVVSSASVSVPAVATSAPAVATTQAPVQTTLQSIAKPSTTVVSAPAPIATGTAPGNGTGSGSGSGSTAGAYAVGTACTTEGAWNCIGGSSFQRCASGAWSAVTQMAAGTSCSAGESAQLKMIAKKHLGRYQRRHGYAHLSN